MQTELTLPTTESPTPRRAEFRLPTDVQKVAIVNGTGEILSTVESVLATGHYDVVFVESVAHAYSHIKRVQPHLIILCVRLDDAKGFQVLSMLKMDEETRHIPILTYAAGFDGQDEEESSPESEPDATAEELFGSRPSLMN